MKLKISNILSVLVVIFLLSFTSFQAVAAPIQLQDELQAAITQMATSISLDFDVSDIILITDGTFPGPWMSGVEVSITQINITTLPGGFSIKPDGTYDTRFLDFSSDSEILLDSASSLAIEDFLNDINGNGNVYTQGGAIYAAGALDISGGTHKFNNNSAFGTSNDANNGYGHGGAIYTVGALRFLDGIYTFENNSVSGIGDGGISSGRGGAIYAGGDLSFLAGTYNFNGNTAYSSGDGYDFGYSSLGGAIYAHENLNLSGDYNFNGNSVSVQGSDLASNWYGYGRGGAIYSGKNLVLSGNAHTFTYNEALLTGNFGHVQGGAIYAGGTLTFEESTYDFTGNLAKFTDLGTDFSYNYNKSQGGAIYAAGALAFNGGNYTFRENEVSVASYLGYGQGGAIYAAGALTFKDGDYIFDQNIVDYVFSDSLYYIDYIGDAQGGAIYAASALEFEKGTYGFTGNSATVTEPASLAPGNIFNILVAGGAISGSKLTFTEGTYDFIENSTSVSASGTIGDASHGYGGAISATDLTLKKGTYTFTGNFVEVTSLNAGSLSYGGAIYIDGSGALVSEEGTYIFSGNSTSSSGNARGGSYGGAIYAAKDLILSEGVYTFRENSVSSNAEKDSDAKGGAIATGNLTLSKGTYTFRENSVSSTGITGYGDAYGGAILGAKVTFEEGTYIFRENTVFGTRLGAGGAVYAEGAFKLSGGRYVFIRNSASSDGIGAGGAIFAGGGLSLEGGIFINNTASSFGGAIFVDSSSLDINSVEVEIIAKEGYPVVFWRNEQNTSDVSQRNSIYFGGNGAIDATFNVVDEDALFIMLDPIHSSAKGEATIVKKGPGVWQLGGHSILKGEEDTIEISNGILRLLASNDPLSPTTIEMTGSQSSFIIGTDGQVQVVANLYPVYIKAHEVTVDGHMSLWSDPRYSITGAPMVTGDKVVLMYVEAELPINQNGSGGYYNHGLVNEVQPTEGDLVAIGAYLYSLDYEPDGSPLRWEIDPGDPNKGTLSLYFKDKQPNLLLDGTHSLKVPGIEMLSNVTTLSVLDRGLGWLTDDDRRKNNLWFESSLTLAQIDKTVELININYSIGYDREFFEDVIIGVAYSHTMFNYRERLTYAGRFIVEMNANSINPTIILYSAAKLFSVINMASLISYGFNWIDQYRNVYVDYQKETLHTLYSSHMIRAAVSLDYPIAVGKVFLKPAAGYEFMYLFSGTHKEESIYKQNTSPGVNSLALIYGNLKHIVHQITAGLKASYNFDKVTIEGKIMFLGLFGDLFARAENSFVYKGYELFGVEGRIGYTYNLNFGLTAKIDLKHNVDVFFGYNGIINVGGYSHTTKLNFSYGF